MIKNYLITLVSGLYRIPTVPIIPNGDRLIIFIPMTENSSNARNPSQGLPGNAVSKTNRYRRQKSACTCSQSDHLCDDIKHF